MASRRLGEVIKVSEELIKKAWSQAIKAHNSPNKLFVVEKSRSSTEAIFSFPGYWSVDNWFTGSPFGEKKIDLGKFASLKSIGNEDVAIFNEAFLNRFDAILSQLQIEVRRAVTDKKKIVFTGHSSGGPIAILAAVWFLQNGLDLNKTMKPLCITFGSPLVGDRIFNHALSREDWSQCFTHFVMRYDIFPRVPLAPLESTARSSGIDIVLNELGLSTRARLCLCAVAELEKQKLRNQKKINDKIPDIEQALKILEGYKARCEAREVSYYDAFKASRDPDDFNANVKRLALAGICDEIMEMLKKYDLPDGFEGCQEWVKLGTRYRRIVEPLDIANYYRHLKNEDTGPYMTKGRPRRYRYTQKWLEYADHLPTGTCLESSFWAQVEELIQTSNRNPFEAVQAKVSHLESQVKTWIEEGVLGDDIFLENSTFVNWWKSHPQHHTSTPWFSTRIK
ncbi:hypothetical protein Q3G72_010188 [Acer saccharum]|nr:hypothetical protein Q3G72_010188 [Acer saccharum]